MEKLTVHEYFERPETVKPEELASGVVREPPMPSYGHQLVATRLMVRLHEHVEQLGLGQVCGAVDVVLDPQAALVVQPDILFVTSARLGIIRERVWGAPDLVVEVLSPSTARRDRTTKLGWYRAHGVSECWLVDAGQRTVEVFDLQSTTPSRLFTETEAMRSHVLPHWRMFPGQCFD
jgi:Uma2 family endonuclease